MSNFEERNINLRRRFRENNKGTYIFAVVEENEEVRVITVKDEELSKRENFGVSLKALAMVHDMGNQTVEDWLDDGSDWDEVDVDDSEELNDYIESEWIYDFGNSQKYMRDITHQCL